MSAVPRIIGRGAMLMNRIQDDIAGGPRESLPLPNRFLINPTVHHNHNDTRYPEADRTTDNGVIIVNDEFAFVRMRQSMRFMLLRRVPTEENRREADQRRKDPNVRQHKADHSVRHGDRVFERSHYRVVPVDADTAQMEYRSGRKVNVERIPHVAHERTEQPLTAQFDARVEGHRAKRHQHIRHGQTDHVVIGNDAQFTVSVDADDDQGVAENRAQYYQAEYATFYDQNDVDPIVGMNGFSAARSIVQRRIAQGRDVRARY